MVTQRADSEVDVCNLALGLIQEKSITSLDDRHSKAARECKKWYPVTRDRLLSEYRWNFNTERRTLAQAGAPPAYGFPFAYVKPGDVLRILELNGETEEEWEVESEIILSHLGPPVAARVLYQVPEPRKWSAHFLDLLAHELAVVVGPKIARRRAIPRELLDKLQDLRAKAKSVDAREARETKPELASEFIAVRQV